MQYDMVFSAARNLAWRCLLHVIRSAPDRLTATDLAPGGLYNPGQFIYDRIIVSLAARLLETI